MNPPDPEKVGAWVRFGKALISPLQAFAEKIRAARARRIARKIEAERERQERQNERVLGKDYKKRSEQK